MKTAHYKCDVCLKVIDPSGLRWESQASRVFIKFENAWPQADIKYPDVCPGCAATIHTAIFNALSSLRPEPKSCSS